ncbi:anacyclamide/piricyclamide family prenylated cyclic peptide [Oxynema aestuarii]|uniref:Anacyclamide/piricyclamide family prenylated cyclic peptide n=1 Tax=Oxynema aestuarii AP17 TaxID=2064643 RepID=A0A6H1TYU1_9CYAN|nr:anacyclamide/piricyclamide family prenylated cyclic peptide [Oxynema aestuarii]QIZ71376.1 anacyclamide/piricyclamide family prenylated cyclic peptide [Oxynema aestuarii AP17]
MKNKKLTPANVPPVKRETCVTTSRDGNRGSAIAPLMFIVGSPFSLGNNDVGSPFPFAGNDAE